MTKLVSVSGAAGTGKSTLLENIKHPVDSFRVARAVLSKMGMDLYDILKDPKRTMEFQDMILEWKIANDEHLTQTHQDSEWIFVERCPADFYAFAKTWQSRFSSEEYDSWLKDYHQECFDAMRHYDVAILIAPGHFAHVDDGVRAKADTQDDTHRELDTFLSRRWMHTNFDKPRFHVHRLTSSDIMDRVNEVENALSDAEKYFKPIFEKMSDL